jgi:hypothetical protein
MNYKIIHNGKMTTHLEPPMPDEISGMDKTNGNASLICKKRRDIILADTVCTFKYLPFKSLQF